MPKTSALNVRQTAEELGIHENTVRNWEEKGLLRGIRLPGSGFRRFPKQEVERMRREMFAGFESREEPLEEANSGTNGQTISGDEL